MIGNVFHLQETKKPVSKTGAFGAVTALSVSSFMNTHSVHHNAGMCKDSLIKSQNSLNVPAQRGAAVVPDASFRKESFAMVASLTFELNGIPLGFILDGGQYSDGVVIPLAADIELPHFQETLRLARFLYSDFLDYVESYESNTLYAPSLRNVPKKYQANRDEFTGNLVQKSQNNMEYRRNMLNRMSSKQKKDRAGYIYLLKAREANPVYKIGRSRQLETRVNWFNTKLPFEIDVSHTFKTNDTIQAEKYLHDLYAATRINGEWFALSEEDVQAICAIPEMTFEVES